MRYLCLVYLDPGLASTASAEDWHAIQRACLDYNEELKQSGHYITSNALAEPNTATTVRKRRGQSSITDGPFAETKEVLCGFVLIEARDHQEAVEIGARSPMAQMGAIEIRETAGF